MEQAIFNWIIGIAGILGGWVLKVIWDSLQTLRAELKSMDSKMHEDFVRRDDFKETMAHIHKDMDEMKQDMKVGFSKIEVLIGTLFDRLNSKADK
jgi:hypothetical protein